MTAAVFAPTPAAASRAVNSSWCSAGHGDERGRGVCWAAARRCDHPQPAMLQAWLCARVCVVKRLPPQPAAQSDCTEWLHASPHRHFSRQSTPRAFRLCACARACARGVRAAQRERERERARACEEGAPSTRRPTPPATSSADRPRRRSRRRRRRRRQRRRLASAPKHTLRSLCAVTLRSHFVQTLCAVTLCSHCAQLLCAAQSPRIVMRCAPRASNGPNHLGLRTKAGCEIPAGSPHAGVNHEISSPLPLSSLLCPLPFPLLSSHLLFSALFSSPPPSPSPNPLSSPLSS